MPPPPPPPPPPPSPPSKPEAPSRRRLCFGPCRCHRRCGRCGRSAARSSDARRRRRQRRRRPRPGAGPRSVQPRAAFFLTKSRRSKMPSAPQEVPRRSCRRSCRSSAQGPESKRWRARSGPRAPVLARGNSCICSLVYRTPVRGRSGKEHPCRIVSRRRPAWRTSASASGTPRGCTDSWAAGRFQKPSSWGTAWVSCHQWEGYPEARKQATPTEPPDSPHGQFACSWHEFLRRCSQPRAWSPVRPPPAWHFHAAHLLGAGRLGRHRFEA
mmetsp:Transcript_116847/g.371949  ORF Transcript_116847/g.371949 Transcript_116847/m.371949 type:complete len:269 (+) Transcript_116847:1392-2198(+)